MPDVASLQNEIDRLTAIEGYWNTAIIVLMMCAALSATGLVIAQRFAFAFSDKAAFASGRLTALKEAIADGKTAAALKQAAEANERAGVAGLDAATAKEGTSLANARAAEASKAAETERIERLQLEAKIAPRLLTKEQRTILASNLSAISERLNGRMIRVVSYSSDTEAFVYLEQLSRLIADAKIRVDDESLSITPSGSLVFGIAVFSTNNELADLVLSALNGNGSSINAIRAVADPAAGAMSILRSNSTPDLTLIVGHKMPDKESTETLQRAITR